MMACSLYGEKYASTVDHNSVTFSGPREVNIYNITVVELKYDFSLRF